MKKISLSTIHILIAILALFLGISKLDGQARPEMIPYKLVEVHGERNLLRIEIVEPSGLWDLPPVYRDEVLELIYHRVKLQETGYWIFNDVFWIDDRPYVLVKLKENY
tara:strand:- start:63 stop:386 length:324 start_codon:yes stop_codon:yes gene_type:complete